MLRLPRTFAALAVAVSLVAVLEKSAWASAVETVGQDGRYLGAGGIGVAEDPVAVFHNPSGVAEAEGTHLQVDGLFMDADLYYTELDGNKHHAQKDVYQPGVFITSDSIKPFNLGFGIFSSFARDIRYDADPNTGFPELHGKNIRIDYEPVIAYRLNDRLSIGGGPIYAQGTYQDKGPAGPPPAPIINATADGDGWGYAVGVHFKATEKLNLGAVWKSRMDIEASGVLTTETPNRDGGTDLREPDFDLLWKYPQQVGLGASYAARKNLQINFDAIWTEWSYWDTVPIDVQGKKIDPPDYVVNGQDSWKLGLGISYDVTVKTSLRAGYQYDQRGIPEERVTPSKPDASGSVFIVGAGYKFTPRLKVNAGYFLTMLSEDNATNNKQGFPGKYQIDAQGGMLSVVAAF